MTGLPVDRAVAVLHALGVYGQERDGREPMLSELPELLAALRDDLDALAATLLP